MTVPAPTLVRETPSMVPVTSRVPPTLPIEADTVQLTPDRKGGRLGGQHAGPRGVYPAEVNRPDRAASVGARAHPGIGHPALAHLPRPDRAVSSSRCTTVSMHPGQMPWLNRASEWPLT